MTLHLTETFQWRLEYVSTLLEDSDRFWQWLHRRDKKLYRPAAIRTWAIVIYESQGRFRQDTARDMARGFIEGALSVGKYILYIRFFFAAKLINFTQEWLCPILNRWSSGRTGKETLEMYVFVFFHVTFKTLTWPYFLFLSIWGKPARLASIRREALPIWSSSSSPRAAMKSIRLLRSEQYILPLACISSHWCLSRHLVSATYRWVQLLSSYIF